MAHFTTDLQGAGSGLSCEEREALRDNCDSALDLIESSTGALLLYECSLKIGTLSRGASAAGDVVIYADDTSIDRCAAPLEHLGRALTDPALTGMRSYSGKLNELLTFGRGGEKPLEISEYMDISIYPTKAIFSGPLLTFFGVVAMELPRHFLTCRYGARRCYLTPRCFLLLGRKRSCCLPCRLFRSIIH